MEKEETTGAVRNREQTRQKFLAAVGEILTTKGFAALKVNDIAKVAGLDKKLIYNYFGGRDQLIDEYIKLKDFWSNVKGEQASVPINNGGAAFVEEMVLSQFDYVYRDEAFQKILLWSLSEERGALKKLIEAQEANGELLLQGITDPHFGERSAQFRAAMAVIISGTYYLDLFSKYNGTTFCGIDVNDEAGRAEIKKSLSFLIRSIYSHL
ncbi:TetR/AcrR family transcriptional regulator [Mucilaginibacter conchicola]|uniref:TetR/AcrR family transcriptional regulator n=1 Tax=Mucilaginibacter conchicola TaxID=2303333 RepID=A0A372NZC8_9SPHI|nr:TetR/AcrR family transcriptional regulator [Mucilaginibacter conchicola]RFZ95466.1 TetR/AcrR family transcriptional regulator [Mucilaginibacter conchicola]